MRLQASQIVYPLVTSDFQRVNAAFINAQRQPGQGPDSLLAERKLKAKEGLCRLSSVVMSLRNSSYESACLRLSCLYLQQ